MNRIAKYCPICDMDHIHYEQVIHHSNDKHELVHFCAVCGHYSNEFVTKEEAAMAKDPEKTIKPCKCCELPMPHTRKVLISGDDVVLLYTCCDCGTRSATSIKLWEWEVMLNEWANVSKAREEETQKQASSCYQ